jgi:hypothetical protein
MDGWKKNAASRAGGTLVLVLMLGSCLAALPALGESDRPVPEGRTYFTVLLGSGSGGERYLPEAACVQFRRQQICFEGQCGILFSLDAPDQTRKRTAFGFEIILDDPDHTHLLGWGRADDWGAGSSIGGVVEAATAQGVANLSFAGRSAAPAKCRRLLDELDD